MYTTLKEPEDDFYKQKVLDYAQEQKKRNLDRRGIVDEDIEKVYVIYARKSTTDKEHQQRSIQDQIKECKEFAIKNSLKYVDVQTEEQTAHKSEKRDVFYDILNNIKQGKRYNSIITWHPDRLARNMKDAGEIMDLLDRGVIQDLQFPSYTFFNDASGKMALGIQFVLAKNYSDNLSNNTKRGNNNKVIEGKYMGKQKHGYTANKHSYYKPNESFEIIKESWNLIIKGTPLKTIKQFFVDKGYKNLGHSTISRIYTDTFYTGIYVHGDNVIDLRTVDKNFKPMVSFKDFVTVRQLLKERSNFNPEIKAENILFKKMVKCEYCNHYMSPYRAKGKYGDYYYYIGCVNEYCETVKNKKLKRAIRGKVIIDCVIDLLSTKFNIEEPIYNQIVTDYLSSRTTSIDYINSSISTIKGQINKITLNINGLAKSLDTINDKGQTVITNQMKELSEDKADKQIELEQLEEQKIRIESIVNEKIMPYENFLNFFQNAEQEIKSTTDVYLLDQLIRNIFLNFFIKEGKVFAYELKEPFATYLKLGEDQYGVAGGARTHDTSLHRRVLYH